MATPPRKPKQDPSLPPEKGKEGPIEEANRKKEQLKEDIEAVKEVRDLVVKYFNAAYKQGLLVGDASDAGTHEMIWRQQLYTYVSIYTDLVQKIDSPHYRKMMKDLQIDPLRSPESELEIMDTFPDLLKAYFRERGYVLDDSDRVFHNPKRRESYRIISTELRKIKKKENEGLNKYFPDRLNLPPNTDVEVLYVGSNLIKGRKEVMASRGITVPSSGGSTERRLKGAAALVFEDDIVEFHQKMFEKDANMDKSKKEEIIRNAVEAVKINEVFHLLNRKIFPKMNTRAHGNELSFSYRERRFTERHVDELFSDLGTLLYSKAGFINLLRHHTKPHPSEAYQLSVLVYKVITHKTCNELGIPISNKGVFNLKRENIEAFETKFKELITEQVFKFIDNLKEQEKNTPE